MLTDLLIYTIFNRPIHSGSIRIGVIISNYIERKRFKHCDYGTFKLRIPSINYKNTVFTTTIAYVQKFVQPLRLRAANLFRSKFTLLDPSFQKILRAPKPE
jgi:hypothetical protein